MNTQISKDDFNFEWNLEEMKTAYKRAAEYDDYLFGDFDYSYIWKETDNDDVY